MKAHNPFQPGTGETPPRLAGRAAEQAEYHELLSRLRDEKRGKIVVMYGPRGVGKTALLAWLEGVCADRMTVVNATPDRGGDLPPARFKALLPRRLWPDQLSVAPSAGFNKFGVEVGVSMSAVWEAHGDDLEASLLEACSKTPRVLLLDEAHHLNEGARQWLFSMAQRLIRKAPFLLALAGTPGLVQAVRGGVTFIDRAPAMSISLLPEEAAAEAVEAPLTEEGVTLEREALSEVVEDAQGYPFFLQLWGEALWDLAKETGLRQLGPEALKPARAAVHGKRQAMYSKRFADFVDNDDLFTAAVALSDAYQSGGSFDDFGIRHLIEAAFAANSAGAAPAASPGALARALHTMDYVWQPEHLPYMVPGIPSFMNYVRQRRLAGQAPLPAADIARIRQESERRQRP